MRIATELIVQAILRRASAAGASAYVVHRGDSERGALYLKLATLDGKARLLGPPPSSLSEAGSEPAFEDHLASSGVPEREVDAHMRRQIEFDTDLWFVEIEDRQGRSFVGD